MRKPQDNSGILGDSFIIQLFWKFAKMVKVSKGAVS